MNLVAELLAIVNPRERDWASAMHGESNMYSSECRRQAERRAFLRASHEMVDEARDRGSLTGWWSALLLAIAIFLTLWSADFVLENAAPARQAIEHDVHLLTQKIGVRS
jgi:hypothetical protein